jgi:serine/threonine-protein phosphatase 2A regulatory subunit B
LFELVDDWKLFLRFEESEPPGTRSFFTEIIASISDIKFARGGRYILSRDYMTLKVCFSAYY